MSFKTSKFTAVQVKLMQLYPSDKLAKHSIGRETELEHLPTSYAANDIPLCGSKLNTWKLLNVSLEKNTKER
jgi:hypothetical protein